MRVLVTGAGGYLGRSVVAALHNAGHEPVAMVHKPSEPIPGATATRVAELLDVDALREAVDGADAVCHLAGLTRARESLLEPLRYFRVNTGGTIELLDAMSDAGVPRLVFGSTGAIYGSPDQQPMDETLPDRAPHPYAASKLAAELAIDAQARALQLDAIIVRLFNVAGGSDPDPTRLIPRVISAAAHRTTLEINGDGSSLRDYLHVGDAADAFVACIDHTGAAGPAVRYNIGSGRETSVVDVVAAVQRVSGLTVPTIRRPAAAEPHALISNPSKAMAELGWSPARSDIGTIVSDAWTAVTHR